MLELEKLDNRITELKQALEDVTKIITQNTAQLNAIAGAISELESAKQYLSPTSPTATPLEGTTDESEKEEGQERQNANEENEVN